MPHFVHRRGRPSGERLKLDMKNLTRTGFNVKRPIKVMIHGYLQDLTWADRMVRGMYTMQFEDREPCVPQILSLTLESFFLA